MPTIKVQIPEESKYGTKVKLKAKLGEKQDQVLGAPPPRVKSRRPATNPQDGTRRRK